MKRATTYMTSGPNNLAQDENRHGSFGTVAPTYARSSTQVNIILRKI